jgi:hypothetical protein
VNVSKFICRVVGHKYVGYFDGRTQCARCKLTHYPAQGSDTIWAMRQHDPEWAQKHGSSSIPVAVAAFYMRNGDYGGDA